MLRFSPTLKKILLIGTVILVGCDVSMLFAAPINQTNTNTPIDPQLLQLQTQVQQQIKALQNQNNSVSPQASPMLAASTTMAPADAPANPTANPTATVTTQTQTNTQTATSQTQNQPNSLLPPAPFESASNPNQAQDAAALQQQQQNFQNLPQTTPNIPPATTPAQSQSLATSALAQTQLQGQQQPQTPAIAAMAATAAAGTPPPAAPANPLAASAQQAQPEQQNQGPGSEPGPGPGSGPGSEQGQGQGPNQNNTTQITPNDVNDAAFNAMVENSLPMSPAQIQKLRSMYMASQFAASMTPDTPPRPTATSQFVDLSPGSTPPVVRLSQGFITSLVFVDSTGAPWPIEAYDVGNPSAFNIQWDKTSNTLMVQSAVLYTYGNLAIKLKGLDTPVMITLIPGQKAVDYRVDLRIQGFGPNAQPFPANVLPPSTSLELLNVLDGVPPAGSSVLRVQGGDCQAWLSGGKMYVRTRLNILSPGWIATLSSADGMHAYEMQASPMILVSQNGQVVQLKVEGF